MSSGEGGEEKLEQTLDEDNVVKGLPNNDPTNPLTQSLEPSLTEASKEVKINLVEGLAINKTSNLVTQFQQPIENAASMGVEDTSIKQLHDNNGTNIKTQSKEQKENEATNLVSQSEDPIVKSPYTNDRKDYRIQWTG